MIEYILPILATIGLVLVFFFFRPDKRRKAIAKIEPLKKKFLVFATPHRLEMFLVFAYATFFLWWDVLQNKVLDLGTDYRVTWFGDVTTKALDLSIVILILFHVTLMALFVLSLQSKRTHRVYDIVIGTLAFFGVAIVLAGFINSIYSETIRFLFINMKSVTFYHIGVAIEFMAGLYWTLTK